MFAFRHRNWKWWWYYRWL